MLDVKTHLVFFGMSRSGNHALINWILKKYSGKRVFINNCGNCSQNYLDPSRINWIIFDGEKEITTKKNLRNVDILLTSFEDSPKIDSFSTKIDFFPVPFCKYEKRTIVHLLRDPFNLFSSRMRATGFSISESLWVKHAKYFCDEERYFAKIYKNNVIKISFNEWHSTKEYRKKICDKLEVKFSDDGKEDVSAFYSAGSSFDKMKYDGAANKMNVLNRYMTINKKENEMLKKSITSEVKRLAYKIFNMDVEL